MRIGIPKGLLYYRYHAFFETFFSKLGSEIIVSEQTNKDILDMGVQFCVDEACLPVKVFHGHAASIKDRCDYLIIPRIMSVCIKEYICPKFCGLPEMIIHSIPRVPKVSVEPLYMRNEKELFRWCLSSGSVVTKDSAVIKRAFISAVTAQKKGRAGINEQGRKLTVMLAGHPYIIYDDYLNMGIINKLRAKGIGIITEESVGDGETREEVKKLVKKPFWTFQRRVFGAACVLLRQKLIDGIIYLSSFACGIDSVIIDLIRHFIGNFPMLVIKLDEHTGEAGVDTRVEAFIDMLERRVFNENYNPSPRECVFSGQNPV
ncbi:MAG TPA: 2-hydroxyglutaryl-CoA dehydratase [Ruminiclostridium sp.]|jgi:predicted nucleotide-binding protein (sugar kinase/HSP70/actin superfamily)|nr:2-hydroxyglutaryl-CoA dehydratase [Clostridiaceae bacterium]HAA25136.1 2-hydroxyglutaryl-CoA dehydratase [Ruminiclostridium sp.]